MVLLLWLAGTPMNMVQAHTERVEQHGCASRSGRHSEGVGDEGARSWFRLRSDRSCCDQKVRSDLAGFHKRLASNSTTTSMPHLPKLHTSISQTLTACQQSTVNAMASIPYHHGLSRHSRRPTVLDHFTDAQNNILESFASRTT